LFLGGKRHINIKFEVISSRLAPYTCFGGTDTTVFDLAALAVIAKMDITQFSP
jgi:hypothetical protein